MFLKELMLAKQVHQKSAIFATFLDKGFKFQPNICNVCHDVLMMSMKLSNIAILSINGSDYRCKINGIGITDAVNLLQKGNLIGKSRIL